MQRDIDSLERTVSKLEKQVAELHYTTKPVLYGHDQHGNLKSFDIEDVVAMLCDHLGLKIKEEGAKLVPREKDGD
jgi:hypothetical protein